MRFWTVCLLGTLLLTAACADNNTPMPTAIPELDTPTPAAATELTTTAPLPESTGLTATATMTDATAMTDSATLTDSTAMTDSVPVTETMGITPSEQLTATGTAGLLGVASLQNGDGEYVGNAIFTQTSEGVIVQVTVEGFTAAAAGPHGIHIHMVGACTPDFAAAGSHFNPTAMQHGLDNPAGPHAGDLPNLEIDADGNGAFEATTDLITLEAGDHSVFDSDGSALVIHADPDDMMTDPSGNSGDRIACGVIEQQ